MRTKRVLIKRHFKMLCQKCSYDWTPRKESPKECPRCKVRLDYNEIQLVVGGNN